MKHPLHTFLLAGLFALAIGVFSPAPNTLLAQTGTPALTDAEPPVGMQGGRFGLGFISSWPSYGLSGTLQVNEKITAEAVLGFLGAVSNFGGRGWYRFRQDPMYDLYAYGAASIYRYDYVFDNENVLGLGAGAGIEASLGKLLDQEDFPPIFVNVELGLAYADFKYYDFSSFVWGSGIHYRFGARK